MDTRLVRDPAEAEQLLSDGYELDSIVFWADNPERSYMLVKRRFSPSKPYPRRLRGAQFSTVRFSICDIIAVCVYNIHRVLRYVKRVLIFFSLFAKSLEINVSISYY